MQIPKKMKAVILKGHDGMSKLEYKFDVDFSIHNKVIEEPPKFFKSINTQFE